MSGVHSVQQARILVEQLRREHSAHRVPVSTCVNDLIKFVRENQKDDCLISGFANDKLNPYRSKSSFQCLVL